MNLALSSLAKGMDALVNELRRKHGAGRITLQDVAPADRPLVESAVQGKQSFTVDQVSANLDDAFHQMKKADHRFFFGGNGKLDPVELAKATMANPAASPLYMRVAQRISEAADRKQEAMDARYEQIGLRTAVPTAEYEAAIAKALEPFAEKTGREAFDHATQFFGFTNSQGALAATRNAFVPVANALAALETATLMYTHEEKESRIAKDFAVVRGIEEQIEKAPTYQLGRDLEAAKRFLEVSQSRPSVSSAVRDEAMDKANAQLDAATKHLKSVIAEHAGGLLIQPPRHMPPDELATARAAADERAAKAEAGLAAVAPFDKLI